MPRYPPEPYTILRPTSSTNDVYNHNGLNNYEEFNGSFPSDHNNHLDFNHEENHGHEDLSSDDSNSMTIAQEQTQKVRKPAKFFLGKPQKIHSSSEFIAFFLDLSLLILIDLFFFFQTVRPLLFG